MFWLSESTFLKYYFNKKGVYKKSKIWTNKNEQTQQR